MKSVAVEDGIYNEMLKSARSKNTTLTSILREEGPWLVDKIKNGSYKEVKNGKKKKEVIDVKPQKELDTTNKKSLANIVYDLVELDLEAPENQAVVEAEFKKLTTKVNGYVAVYNMAQNQSELLQKEIEFLGKQVKRYFQLVEFLKVSALKAMDNLGVKELVGDNGHKVYVRDSSSVEVVDVNKVPDEYVTIKTTQSVDKRSVSEVYKKGGQVEGTVWTTNRNVQFK